MMTQRKLMILFLACLIGINLIFAGTFNYRSNRSILIQLLPLLSSDILLVGTFIVFRVAYNRRTIQLNRTSRRIQSLQMILEDRETEAQILQTISEVSAEFLEKMELRPLLDRISRTVHDLLKVEISAIEVFPQSGEEAMRFVRGAETITFGDEVYHDVVGRGKSLLINNLSRSSQYKTLGEQNIRSTILAPLTLHGRSIGFVGAFARIKRNFTSKELRLLHSLANHAALMVETTQLLETVRHISFKESDSIADLRHFTKQLSYEKRLRERELEVARRIQTDLLPHSLPQINSLILEGVSYPAKEVGGDYFDVLDLGDGRWGIAIADVSGKGVPAALVMVMTRTLLHSLVKSTNSPAELLTTINGTLYKETDPTVFVSMLYGIWDSRNSAFIYSNAGHEPPIISLGRTTEQLGNSGIALGAIENVSGFLEDKKLTLEENDALLLFTDGATEAHNASRERYGQEHLLAEFEKAASKPQAILDRLLSSIKDFTGTAPQHDDITMVCLRRRGFAKSSKWDAFDEEHEGSARKMERSRR